MLALLSFGVFLYAAASFIATPIPGLSRLTHLSLLILALGAVLLAMRGRTSVRVGTGGFGAFAAGFVALSLLSAYWAADADVAALRATSVGVSALGAWLVLCALRSGVTRGVVVAGVGLGGLVNGGVALGQFLSGDIQRAAGLTGNANLLGIQLSVVALMLLSKRQHMPRVMWSLAFVVLATASVLTASRKLAFVWLVLAIVLAVDLRATIMRSRRMAGVSAVVICCGFGAISLNAATIAEQVSGSLMFTRFQRLLEGRDTSGDERLAMMGEGMALWMERPILGHGMDQFRVKSSFGTYSHNNYVEVAVGVGLLGGLLMYGMHLCLLLRTWRLPRWYAYERRLVIGSVLLVLLWDLAFVSHYERVSWLFWACLWSFVLERAGDRVGRGGVARVRYLKDSTGLQGLTPSMTGVSAAPLPEPR